jgi:uncharacterized damage-inducible protein DinB
MTATFTLNQEKDKSRLLDHLAQHQLFHPANCVVTIQNMLAVVTSPNAFALGTAKTAW